MSEPESVASAHMAAIHQNHRLDFDSNCVFNHSCHFAYVKNVLPPDSRDDAIVYVVLGTDGALTYKRVSLIKRDMLPCDNSEYHYIGIALKCVHPATINIKKLEAMGESQLVAELRVAIAEGKFTPP
jgi:hypothetical protein